MGVVIRIIFGGIERLFLFDLEFCLYIFVWLILVLWEFNFEDEESGEGIVKGGGVGVLF